MNAAPPLLSLAEITALERAYALGAPTLGTALRALCTRWDHHLRDDETLVRAIFLAWIGRTEPNWDTGIRPDSPRAELFVDQAGGESALPAETCFILGWLALRSPGALGTAARWSDHADALFGTAERLQPESAMFGSWRFFAGLDNRARTPRPRLLREVHARFAGRGTLGDHLRRALSQSLRQLDRQIRL